MKLKLGKAQFYKNLAVFDVTKFWFKFMKKTAAIYSRNVSQVPLAQIYFKVPLQKNFSRRVSKAF